MKRLFLLSFLLIFIIATGWAQVKKKPVIYVKKIAIHSADFMAQAPARVDPKTFDANFKDMMYHINITQPDEVKKISGLLHGMKHINNTIKPDVRCRLLLYKSNNKTDTVYLSQIVLRYKNQSYATPKDLVDLINNKKK